MGNNIRSGALVACVAWFSHLSDTLTATPQQRSFSSAVPCANQSGSGSSLAIRVRASPRKVHTDLLVPTFFHKIGRLPPRDFVSENNIFLHRKFKMSVSRSTQVVRSDGRGTENQTPQGERLSGLSALFILSSAGQNAQQNSA